MIDANRGVRFVTLLAKFLFRYCYSIYIFLLVSSSSYLITSKPKTRLDLLACVNEHQYCKLRQDSSNRFVIFQNGEELYSRDYIDPNKKIRPNQQ